MPTRARSREVGLGVVESDCLVVFMVGLVVGNLVSRVGCVGPVARVGGVCRVGRVGRVSHSGRVGGRSGLPPSQLSEFLARPAQVPDLPRAGS